MIRAIRRLIVLVLVLAVVPCVLVPSQDVRRSERFSGPPRDPPARNFDFLHLRLECAFDWETESVEASVTHKVKAFRKGARTVELDAVGIDVKSVTLAGGPGLVFERLPEKVRIDLGKESDAGEESTFSIAYRARPRQGVYFQRPYPGYPDVPKQVWTQGETEEARHWIPCFDHPSDKLTTEVLVRVPKPLLAVSNGKLLSTEERGDDRVFHWLQDKPHTTYLIAVIAGEFAVWKGSHEKIPITAYVEKRHEALAPRSFELTGDMMSFFGAKTGYPYPWDKYDQLCVHGFLFGGMENTTATTLNPNTLHDERAALDLTSMDLVSHELAHQWFGNLVTCKDWGDIWLNESFATFFSNLYREHHLGWDEGVFDRWEDANRYKGEDRDRYRRRLSTRSWRSSNDVFDAHSYPKGGRILSMLRHVLGDAPFFAGIKLYLERHAFRPVETADFRMAMEDATGQSLGWFFDEWVFSGGHPGYRVSWSWDAEGRSAKIDVEQTQKTDDLTPLFRMPVVIAIVTPSGRIEHRVWVSERKHSFTFASAERPRMVRFDPGDWILKDLQMEKSREELLYQLASDDDVMGRREAAEALAKMARDEPVTAALLERLGAEPFWGVRLQVAGSLSGLKTEMVRKALLARVKAEPKARVRAEVLRLLGEHGGPEAVAALKEALEKDPSYFCAASAVRALATAAPGASRADVVAALERGSHEDVIPSAAIEVLASEASLPEEERAAAVKRIVSLSAPGRSIPVRMAALRAIGKMGKGSEEAMGAATSALDDPRIFIRLEAIEALASLGDRRAVASLEARRVKESPAIFRDPIEAIDQAIARIRGQTDLKMLREDVQRLEKVNRELEKRLGELEKRGPRVAWF